MHKVIDERRGVRVAFLGVTGQFTEEGALHGWRQQWAAELGGRQGILKVGRLDLHRAAGQHLVSDQAKSSPVGLLCLRRRARHGGCAPSWLRAGGSLGL